ncbi:MAG: hypothetical protein DRQ02_09795 [Candidatus Latescibacterota bacterium]|nr:MAG: hypothetical protein DRQ02_09795 [Candidatus Latescibacterota bacterium]
MRLPSLDQKGQKKDAFGMGRAEEDLNRAGRELSGQGVTLVLLAADGKRNCPHSRIEHKRGDESSGYGKEKKPMNQGNNKKTCSQGFTNAAGGPIPAREPYPLPSYHIPLV